MLSLALRSDGAVAGVREGLGGEGVGEDGEKEVGEEEVGRIMAS